MTEPQHYFPYLFNIDTFNKELKSFCLSSYVTYNSKTELPDDLLISRHRSKEALLTIPFGATIMVQGDKLFYWKTDYDLIDLTQVNLNHIDSGNFLNNKIDLASFSVGHNPVNINLDLQNMVTFVRKEDLKYQQDYYEKFTIVIINMGDINIIPFDWFNKTGGDYGYVWPAIARLDTSNCKLYGHGMRMDEFKVQLDKPCL
jgi:hypothetical protein